MEQETKKCKYCQTDIPAKAKICPNCKKKVERNKVVTGIVALFAILFVIGMSQKISQISKNKQNANSNASSTNEKSEPTLTKSGLIADGVTLKVNSSSKADKISAYNGTMYSSPKDKDGVYLIVNVTIKNDGKKAQSLNILDFNLIGENDETYVPTNIVGADEEYIWIDAINPNMKITGNLAFQVPKDFNIKKGKLCYAEGLFNENETYFKLK